MSERSSTGIARKRTLSQKLGHWTTLAISVALPSSGIALLSFATPAAASDPVAFRSAAPLIAAVAPVAAIEASHISDLTPEPAYETIASGTASYYGRELAGNRTASGERFNPAHLTAAHRTLPLGSKVRVTNSRTGDAVIVRINDRGPFHGNRLIDLSEEAARQIGIRTSGSGQVELAVEAD